MIKIFDWKATDRKLTDQVSLLSSKVYALTHLIGDVVWRKIRGKMKTLLFVLVYPQFLFSMFAILDFNGSIQGSVYPSSLVLSVQILLTSSD